MYNLVTCESLGRALRVGSGPQDQVATAAAANSLCQNDGDGFAGMALGTGPVRECWEA